MQAQPSFSWLFSLTSLLAGWLVYKDKGAGFGVERESAGSVNGSRVDSAGVGGAPPKADFCNSPAAFLAEAAEAGEAGILISFPEYTPRESRCPGSSLALKSGGGGCLLLCLFLLSCFSRQDPDLPMPQFLCLGG